MTARRTRGDVSARKSTGACAPSSAPPPPIADRGKGGSRLQTHPCRRSPSRPAPSCSPTPAWSLRSWSWSRDASRNPRTRAPGFALVKARMAALIEPAAAPPGYVALKAAAHALGCSDEFLRRAVQA